MEKFQNTYRIPSARWQSWDYRWNGAYFVTICTNDKKCYLGEITDGKMKLSGVGILADVFWHEIINHAQDVELCEFVVMPNHIHGILILNGNNEPDVDPIENCNPDTENVETGHALSLNQHHQIASQTIGHQRFQQIGKNSVSSIIGSYKSAVTKHAHRLGYVMRWQERFNDHIIRNDAEYQRIAEYILNNIQKWGNDKFYKDNK